MLMRTVGSAIDESLEAVPWAVAGWHAAAPRSTIASGQPRSSSPLWNGSAPWAIWMNQMLSVTSSTAVAATITWNVRSARARPALKSVAVMISRSRSPTGYASVVAIAIASPSVFAATA